MAQDSLGRVVGKGHMRPVDEDAQPLAMVDERAQRPGFARVARQGCQFRLGVGEQVVERLLQFARALPERRLLAFAAGVVMFQPRLVQPEDPGDPLDPCLAPLRQPFLAGRAVDKIAARVAPDMLHATYLGICCGADYVAERWTRRAGHEDSPSSPQHNLVQSQRAKEGHQPLVVHPVRAPRHRKAPSPSPSFRDRFRRRCWWYRGWRDRARRGWC